MANRQRQPNMLLRRAREGLGLSQERVAELVNAEVHRVTGRAGALTAKAISDWECGWYTWPAQPSRDALCKVFGVADPGKLGFRQRRASRAMTAPVTAELGRRSSEDLVSASEDLILPWTAAGGLRATHVVTDAGDMQRRRRFLTLVGATLTAPAHEWLLAHTAHDTARRMGTDLPADVIDELDLITAGLRRMDDRLGGSNVQSLVAVHLRTVTDLLENRRYNESTGRRLHATAAELLRLGGFLAFDAGNHAQAQRYWVAALHTAHAAADRALGANILGFMSCQAKDLGQTREAITLAETARAGYPASAPRVQAILDLRAAEAHAVGADLTSCRRAIDAAFNRFSDPTPAHGEPGWAYWLDIRHAHGQAGYCYLRLGEWDAAREHLHAAIKDQSQPTSREGALREVLLATTYVRQPRPDLDQCLHLGHRALDTLTSQVSSPRVAGHVSRLTEYLKPYGQNAAVRTFSDRAGRVGIHGHS